MQVIPLNSEGSRRVAVALGDNLGIYIFRTRYNPEAAGWYLDLFSAEGAPLAYGLKLVAPHNLVRHLPQLSAGIGDLRVLDVDGTGNTDPDRLGVGVGLVHYAPGEFAARYPDFDNPAPAPLGLDLDALFTSTPPGVP